MADPRTTSIHDVPDDLLESILLRVSSPVFLARAGAACKLWRRVIAGDRFAALYRSMHAPAVGAYYSNTRRSIEPLTSIRPSFDPFPSAAAGIDPGNFSLDFLSDDVIGGLHRATVMDSRGGLLLIEFRGLQHIQLREAFPDVLVVCEPLTRRYVKIPRLRGCEDEDGLDCSYCQSYLVGAAGGEAGGGCAISMSSFRVLCEIYRGGVAHAAMFTTGGGADSWTEKAIDHVSPKVHRFERRTLGHAAGSWYFYIGGMTWIVLDGSTGEYSSSDLPTTVDWGPDDLTRMLWFRVTDGRDGEPRIVQLLDEDRAVKVYARIGGGNGGEWALESSTLLRYNEKWNLYLWAQGPGFIVVALELVGVCRQLLSVDLETMELKPASEEMARMLYTCTLPCPPTLRACLDV